ncbi:hypothetical protein [Mesorhizobium sp. M0323]|uniref:hypothetical protein n=1 Tax=Mesorhizobium sp. M0323 TaxID=2956938 RepID=UPI0033388229
MPNSVFRLHLAENSLRWFFHCTGNSASYFSFPFPLKLKSLSALIETVMSSNSRL